jgi:DNA-3-methyladenine glycosylase II
MDQKTPRVIDRIRTIEDIEAGLAALSVIDPRLAEIAERAAPVPLRLRDPGFTGLAHIVVAQMVSRASADAIWRRMEEETGEVTAAAYLGLGPEHCRRIGLSRAKETTLRGLAEAVAGGMIDLEGLCDRPAEEAMGQLTALTGIGRWTAEVYLLFCAGHPDVFPSGDVALQNAVGHAFGLSERPSAKAVEEAALAWSPWRGVAARLFWAYYAKEMRRSVLPLP